MNIYIHSYDNPLITPCSPCFLSWYDYVMLIIHTIYIQYTGHGAHLGGVLCSILYMKYYLLKQGHYSKAKRVVRYNQRNGIEPWPPLY